MNTSKRTTIPAGVRILSIILLGIMLITSNTVPICAVSDAAREASAYRLASGYIPEIIPGYAESGTAAIPTEVPSAEASNIPTPQAPADPDTRLIYRYSVTDDEALLRELCAEVSAFSLCPSEKYFVLWDFLALEQDKLAATMAEYARLERMGYSLYDSTLILRATMKGLFTTEEAIRLCALYPETPRRMTALYQFAVYSGQLSEGNEEGALTRSTVPGNTYADAKAYFLDGYPIENIKAAFRVGEKLGVSPASLITRENGTTLAAAAESDELKSLLSLYPINTAALTATAEASARTDVQLTDAALVERVLGTESATARSASSGTGSDGNVPRWLKDVAAPFMVSLDDESHVSLSTGSAYYADTLISIPGRAGFDLNLTLSYNSAGSNLTEPKMSQGYEDSGYVYYIYATSTYEDPYGLVYEEETYCIDGPFDDYETALNQLIDCYPDEVYEGADGSVRTYSYGIVEEYKPYVSNLSVSMVSNPDAAALAAGWSWNLPKMKMSSHEEDGTEAVLHPYYVSVPTLGGFSVWGYDDENGNRIWSAFRDGYSSGTPIGGCTFSEQSTFSNGQIYSTYALSTQQNGHVYYFDANGNFIGERDPFGNTLKYQYNSQNRLTRIIDTVGRQINLSYTASGNTLTITITAPDQSTVVLTLSKQSDSVYHLTKIRRQNGLETAFTYETVTGNTTYDFIVEVTGPSSYTCTATVGYVLLKQITYPTGAKLNYTYTSSNEHAEDITEQLYRVSQAVLSSPSGEMLQRQQIAYTGSHIAHGDNGNIAILTYADNTYCRYEYNGNNQILSEKQYDSRGGLLAESSYTYFAPGLPTRHTEYSYKSGTSSETWTYNQNGTLTKYTSPTGETSTYLSATWLPVQPHILQTLGSITYDILQSGTYRLTGKTIYIDTEYSPDYWGGMFADDSSGYGYDYYGNFISESREIEPWDGDIDNGSLSIRLFENVYGGYTGGTSTPLYLTAVKKDNSVVESYTYDIMGRRTSVTDGVGNTTYTTYDMMGRPLTVTYPNGGSESYVYNDTANTVTHTTRDGVSFKYQYDCLGRLSAVTRLTDNTVIASYVYDSFGRVIEENNAQNLDSTAKILYTYSRLGDDYSTKQVYDRNNVLVYTESASWSGGTYRATVSGLSNYADTVKAYDEHGRLIRESSNALGGTLNYTYDTQGNVTRQTASSPDQPTQIDYTYDYLNRLTSATNVGGDTAYYNYDVRDNVTSAKEFGSAVWVAYTYDARGRVIAESAPFNNTTTTQKEYVYDNADRVILERQSCQADNSTEVTWKTTEYA